MMRPVSGVSSVFVGLLLVSLCCAVLYTPKRVFSPPLGRAHIHKAIAENVYFVELSVGTPPQTQRAILDTELDFSVFVAAASCPSNVMNCFDQRASTTSAPTSASVDSFCHIYEDQIGFQALNYTTTTRYCLTTYNSYVLGQLTNVDGYLGLGYMSYDDNSFDMWTGMLPPDWPLVYGIQFGGSQRESFLHLGGYEHAEDMVWSEQQTNIGVADPVFIEAPFYGVSICGAELQTSTAFTTAQFVTSHNCLGLSRSLFSLVLAWLEDYCWEVSGDLQGGQITCRFEDREQVNQLPSLAFRLSQEGPELRLQLSSLVTSLVLERGKDDLAYRAFLCVVQSDKFQSHTKDKIIFGLMAFEQFYTAINIDEGRVGLHPFPNPNVTFSESLCPVPKICKGDQQYQSSRNKCINPVCRIYENVGKESGKCQLSISFASLVLIALVSLSILDFCASESHLRLERRARLVGEPEGDQESS